MVVTPFAHKKVHRPRAVVLLSSEPRAVSENVCNYVGLTSSLNCLYSVNRCPWVLAYLISYHDFAFNAVTHLS